MKKKKLVTIFNEAAGHSAAMVDYWDRNADLAADAGVDSSFLDLIFSIKEAAEKDEAFWRELAAKVDDPII